MGGTDALPLEENLLLGFLLQMYMVHLIHNYCRPHMEMYYGGGGVGGVMGGYLKRTSYMKIGYNALGIK